MGSSACLSAIVHVLELTADGHCDPDTLRVLAEGVCLLRALMYVFVTCLHVANTLLVSLLKVFLAHVSRSCLPAQTAVLDYSLVLQLREEEAPSRQLRPGPLKLTSTKAHCRRDRCLALSVSSVCPR